MSWQYYMPIIQYIIWEYFFRLLAANPRWDQVWEISYLHQWPPAKAKHCSPLPLPQGSCLVTLEVTGWDNTYAFYQHGAMLSQLLMCHIILRPSGVSHFQLHSLVDKNNAISDSHWNLKDDTCNLIIITAERPTPGPRLNIKTVLSTYGDFHVKDKTAVRTSYL